MTQLPRGRPRSEATRLAVLTATAELIAETGYDRVTIEAIAARAGCGKQTIYRWWSSKSLIVADAVIDGHLRLPEHGVPDTGDLGADLRDWVTEAAASVRIPEHRALIRALAAAASETEAESLRLSEHLTAPHYGALMRRLRAGQARGQLSPEANLDAIADALLGSTLFRVLAGFPPAAHPSAIVDLLLGAGPGGRSG
ncbi:TetR/AcrR family transcriptional regulator [Leucobacter sp. M11]|uniref:TetR/AcrR family transcriptional regulator n=1 Tax=Leucobacter sp. M11 TaxID=2993565 RepID=UPI002D81067F|nr:TetR/AcrR family transcriptional regulator [Leucobacter sp. M11]MEB4616004.1 TetR/AcrR family transcriptional regulator [Leucobacter sp. M11]